MYTWEFRYDEELDGGYGNIQFCAETEEEAIELFKDWCKGIGYVINDYSVENVYDIDDAKEYGNDYKWQEG